ncbi:MAG: integration host factor subunit alpha [Azospirillum brasilense]|nr:MAG: integration host factor subunit alpha [Azospirillum brasilense]
MTSKTLTRADLSNAVYREIGLSLSESTQLVDSVLEEVCGALAAGEQVKLSSFGTFKLRRKKERIGRNPKTGVEVPITPRTVLSFNASNILKQSVNTGELALPGSSAADEF